MMARRADHTAEELTEMIVQTAHDIISTKGIHALSTRALAKQMGYTPGTLYQYFKDINEILLNVHARSLKTLVQEMEACPHNEDPQKMIHDYADIYLKFIHANQKSWDAIFSYQRPADYEIPQWYQDYITTLVSMIADCFKRFEQKNQKTTAMQAAQMIWASIHSVCSLESAGRLNIIMDRALEPLIHDLVDLHIRAYVLPEPAQT